MQLSECNQVNSNKWTKTSEYNQVNATKWMHPKGCNKVNTTKLMQPSECYQMKVSKNNLGWVDLTQAEAISLGWAESYGEVESLNLYDHILSFKVLYLEVSFYWMLSSFESRGFWDFKKL